MNDILGRMGTLARDMARTFLRAAVWRTVYSLPKPLMYLGAAIIFVLLTMKDWG